MKKLLSLALVLALLLSAVPALALDYNPIQNDEPTFELLEETRVSSPIAVQTLEQNDTKTFKSHAVLDGYPEGTTYVYRSANLFGGRAAARLNTDILVFCEEKFESKDDAYAYLEDLGLIAIADEAIGSVILVTPSTPKGIGSTGAPTGGFGANDQKYFYALQTALLAQKAYETVNGARVYYSDAEYMGSYGYWYLIGIDGGATFLNNYVSIAFDFASRIAGMLLVGGDMEAFRQVSTFIPTYLVNAPQAVADKYMKANAVDAYELTDKAAVYYNQAQPLQKVVIAQEEKTNAEYVHDAYYDLFVKAMRVPVVKQGLNSAGTPFQNYNFDEAPYSLCPRNYVVDGRTADGINVVYHKEERFADMKDPDNGEYLQTWFEYLPDEVLDGTAPEHSIPLILANHGGSDDPRVFVDELGLLTLAGQERIALVAPEHQDISGEYREVEIEVLPAITRYMLETYPALDPSRVYAIGYSMGGSATLKAIYGQPALYAAVVAMSPVHGLGEFYEPDPAVQDLFDGIELPVMLTTSGYDLGVTVDTSYNGISFRFQAILNRVLGYNHLPLIEEFDFDTYPTVGFKGDKKVFKTLNNEYGNTTWYLNSEEGKPLVAVSFTEGLIHALYPEYGFLGWNFMKHYTRNPETLEIEYNPYVK